MDQYYDVESTSEQLGAVGHAEHGMYEFFLLNPKRMYN
jgi:hypothetical protein